MNVIKPLGNFAQGFDALSFLAMEKIYEDV